MSNALAIAAVTETLRELLDSVAGASVNGAHAKAVRPDDQNSLPNPGVNIFLYQVSPSAAWRNADAPTRRADGTLLRRPQAALDLYYLLTFYGNDTQLEQQRLLGAVARQIQAQPVLQRTDVLNAQQNAHFLSGANLADQPELVRFTPINFSLEELSKLWSVFLKTDYVLSVAYAASVVLIETDDPPPGEALPVLRPHLRGVPFNVMVIDTVEPQAVALSPPATPLITLQGQGLNVADIVAFTTPGETDPIFGTIMPGATSESLIVMLPSGLRPGVNTVQLTQASASPPQWSPQILLQSNQAAFVILPTILSIGPLSPPGSLQAIVSPPVGPSQQVSLALNQFGTSPLTVPQAFLLPANPHTVQTDTFTFDTVFATGSVPAGNYLVRIRVDVAESRLTVDASGRFSGPIVTIP
jgi:hypothetical protein